ncbi:MAG: hypothetical protein KA144_13510 [Xanthomonadaceae bacterium]|nr:hypothetical protein [Xanthomonadaceae bacterium]
MSIPSTASAPSPLEQTLLALAALAIVAVLSFPAARGASEMFGWLPFWLLALPLSAWATARVLRLRAARAGASDEAARPLASVHTIASARGASVRRIGAQALRRAA